jgi:hypothetical protein
MPNTYTLIANNILSTTASSVTFSSIPATYTDLLIKISVRNNGGSTQNTTLLSLINGTTGFTNRWLRGDGSSVISLPNLVGTSAYVGQNPGSGATSNSFDNTEIYIPNYLVSANKPFSTFSVQETNAATAYLGVTAGLWSNTAAITSITLDANGDSFVSGSSFYLYGIKNS